MRSIGVSTLVLVLAAGFWVAGEPGGAALAQSVGNDPNVLMLDNCSDSDPAYDPFGGCPESEEARARRYSGDVTASEFFALLTSPLAPAGSIVGHPSWRNEPSYITVRQGQGVRVTNRGGRVHTFTKVANFGGGFVPPLNGAMLQAPECNPATVTFVEVGHTQRLSDLGTGLQKFQCCIHPWMRAAIRVE